MMGEHGAISPAEAQANKISSDRDELLSSLLTSTPNWQTELHDHQIGNSLGWTLLHEHQLLLERLYHEDNLLAQRTSNFLANQAFLATALALSLVGVGSGSPAPGGASFTIERKRRPKTVGFGFWSVDAAQSVDTIVAAEMAGVEQIWLTQAPSAPDSLTVFAGALRQTRRIRVGTAITPTYPRHPLLLAQQALALEGLAPGRLRLGLGPASKDVIEGQYGLPMSAPLIHLREYVGLVRSLLWEGHANHQGRSYTVAASLPQAPKTPLLLSALGPAAFRLAGALSDGAISWMAPTRYLRDVALPNLQAGADEARRPRPPLIAHVPVALSDDSASVRAAAQGALDYFRTLPAYVSMFTAAGLFDGPDEEAAARLASMLIVAGNEATVAARLRDVLATEIDELLVTTLPVADEVAERRRLIRLLGEL